MRFYVRLCDIQTADFVSNRDCPIARAIKRKLPKAHVHVRSTSVKINDEFYLFDSTLQANSDKMAVSWSSRERRERNQELKNDFTEGFHFSIKI